MNQFDLAKAETSRATFDKSEASKNFVALKELDEAGCAYHAHGCFAEAESCYQTVLQVMNANDLENADTLETMHRLAILHRVQRKYAEAERDHLEAVRIATKLHGANHTKVAEHKLYLAGFYHSFGRSNEALQAMDESLRAYKAKEGENSPSVGNCHFALALIYSKMPNKQMDAAREYDQAHNISTKHMLGRDETIANGLFGMAMYHYRQGDLESAETLFRHSIILQEESLWPFHPLVPKTLLKLGDFYDSQQLPDKAELCYCSALEKQQAVFGESDPSLVDALTRLAKFYARHGNEEQAREFGRRIIQLEDS
ncbi:MAG TPA: tetratricopeptide repeat protein [Oculatellaceae cyanobacterium]